MVYLDYNATTPCDPQVMEAMLPYFTQKFGNAASRTHPYGWVADEAVEQARKQVAALIHAEPQEIVFTSGATEGCNLALKGVFELYATKGNHIITCVTEHKAVLDTCHRLEQKGASVTYLGVNEEGLIDLKELEAAIRAETILIAIMYANNETGVIQPVKAIGAIAKKHNVLFFTDATQAAGKTGINVREEDIDLLCLSAHKIYGPKGTGALYVRRKNPRVRLMAQIDGGGHERGFRSGTLNVPGIVGLGKACAVCQAGMENESARLQRLRDKLERALVTEGALVNGTTGERLQHVSNIALCNGIRAEKMVSLLNGRIAFSVGSACTSASQEPSHVLQGMGLEEKRIQSSLRLSLGRFTTEEEIDSVIEDIRNTIQKIRINSGHT
jgi:cysteine desulfurase